MTFGPYCRQLGTKTMEASPATEGIAMTPTALGELTHHELDKIAWNFLGSKFTGQTYAQWPIDQRMDAYLLHQGLINVMNDGIVYNALLESVMANIGPALRKGHLGSTPRNHRDRHSQNTRRLPRTAEPAGIRAHPRGIRLVRRPGLVRGPGIGCVQRRLRSPRPARRRPAGVADSAALRPRCRTRRRSRH